MSSLRRGCETNIGLTYRLLMEQSSTAHQTVYYEPGIQWRGLSRMHEVMAGIGLNRQIKRAYLFLARNYQPGDQIVLMGYSRGAYAVRSLAGLIDKMGLLRAAQITPDTLDRIYEMYRCAPRSLGARALRLSRCHEKVTISFLGVYDTVAALGLRWPLLWRLFPPPHPYHSHGLGPATKIARHALALHETRDTYKPVMWDTTHEQASSGTVEQLWFRGTHGDVGGQLDGQVASRPLANVPLVWMLEQAEAAGLSLPYHWRARYLTDANAPSIGTMRGFGKLFLLRHRRRVGADPSEVIHPTAKGFAPVMERPTPEVSPGESTPA